MSPQIAPGQDSDPAAELSDGPGRRLRVARQARGIELDHVAGELHLDPTVVESLERNDYQTLPSQVFVVGYIRKYARLLGLDPEPLLDSYKAATPQSEPVRAGRAPNAARQVGSGHLVVRLISTGILILLGALTFLWWQGRQPHIEVEPVEPHATQEAESEPADAPESLSRHPTPALPTDSELIPTLVKSRPSAAEIQAHGPQPGHPPAPSITEPQASTGAATATAPQEAVREGTVKGQITNLEPTGSRVTEQDTEAATSTKEGLEDAVGATKEVVMSFDGPCWVDVRDSEHRYKLFGEMKKGDRRVLEGTPPYSVILGNAAAARITVGGETFDLTAISRGNVARFTLNPETSQGQARGNTSSALDSVP